MTFEEWWEENGHKVEDMKGHWRACYTAGQESKAQNYPTEDAYLAVCKANEDKRQRIEELENIISGKTFYDVQKQTAERCAEIAEILLIPWEIYEQGLQGNYIAEAIREEFLK